MILATLLLTAVATAAPVRIYQCTSARGETAYQDRPCDDASRQQLSEGGEQALQRWLERQRTEDVARRGRESRTRSQPATVDKAPRMDSAAASAFVRTAAEERLIAACSERFLNCAHSDAAAMDACVARLPRCGQGSSGCCPAACIESYQNLRRTGEGLASAVRLALLDPFAASCATPR